MEYTDEDMAGAYALARIEAACMESEECDYQANPDNMNVTLSSIPEQLDRMAQDADSMQAFHVQWKAQAGSKTQAGRYTLEEAAKLIADNGNEDTVTVTDWLMQAAISGALMVYKPGATIPYIPATMRGFYEEARWHDLNEFLKTNAPILTFRFSNPSKAGTTSAGNANGIEHNLSETTSAGVELTGADTTTPWMTPNDADPRPIHMWYTPARYFARELVKADTSLLGKRDILCKRIVERLNKVGIKKRGNVKQFDPSTINKALAKIDFK